MQPLTFLGIPITKPGYYMNCVMTNAQIELIASDVSVVDYGNHKEDKNMRKKKGEFDDTPASLTAIAEANSEWKERHGEDERGARGLSMKDILGGGFGVGVGVKVEH